MYLELWYILVITKTEVLIRWPGAAHALIMVKLNPQSYTMQQQIIAKFHIDSSTFEKMVPEKPVLANNRQQSYLMRGHGRQLCATWPIIEDSQT